MKRNIDLKEISDGRLYELNDMVKADCNDCKGCFSCCQGMGESIILDPLDICRLKIHLNKSFEELLEKNIELHVVDGIILPNLKMAGGDEKCSFLNEQGRCSIHAFRPSICRIFPMGRFYENGGFKYFLQVNECKQDNRLKVKVKKWIDTPNIKSNEKYIVDWHYFLTDLEDFMSATQDDEVNKNISMYILQNFYIKDFESEENFYKEFAKRLEEAKQGILRGH